MSSRAEKPSLSGQRIRARKRDEKVKYDVKDFREKLVEGLNAAEDFDQAVKFLEDARDKEGEVFDLRRYNEPFYDILITGGTLLAGGDIEDGPMNKYSVFAADPKACATGIERVLRRYNYLRVSLQEEIDKLFKFLRTFSAEHRAKLAEFIAHLLILNLITSKVLLGLFTENLVREGFAVTFLTQIFRVWLQNAGIQAMSSNLKKEKVDIRLLEILPANKRQFEDFQAAFTAAGQLDEFVTWFASQQTADVKRHLSKALIELIKEESDQATLIERVKEFQEKQKMSEVDVIGIIFNSIMDSEEWNKKSEMVGDQALRLLKANCKLLSTFAQTRQSQLQLLLRMQSYCYENQNFLKVFQKFCMLLYKNDVLSEEAILEWYNTGHSPKGKTAFLQQMEQFINWLKNAEEESSEEEEEEK